MEEETRSRVGAETATERQGQATILVLPFEDLTPGGSDYLAEGLSEDLIVALSRHADVSVIALNTAIKLKDDTSRFANPLTRVDAAYMVSGTVRIAGDRIRITAQLSERSTGGTIWSERFDRNLDDIFELQDEIVEALAGRLPWRVLASEGRRHTRTDPMKLSSYQAYLRVTWQTAMLSIDEDIAAFRQIAEADPGFAPARSELGFALFYRAFETGHTTAEEQAEALEHAGAAITLAPDNERVLAKAAMTYQFSGQFEFGLRYSEQAMQINPNSTDCTHFRGTILSASGRAEEALECHRRTLRLDPLFPEEHYEGMMEAHYLLGQYGEALDLFNQWSRPVAHVYSYAAACYALLGDERQAKKMTEAFVQAMPEGASYSGYMAAHLKYHARDQDRKHWLKGFASAGVPGASQVTP